MGQKEGVVPAPERLNACRCGDKTWIEWRESSGAVGYYVYARENEAADRDFGKFSYQKLTGEPVREIQYQDTARNVTYCVTAVDREGRESELSPMVFPVVHEGVEILSIRYVSGENMLVSLPSAAGILVTAVNSTGQDEAVCLEIQKGGETLEFPLVLPGDGRLHEYRVDIEHLEKGPLTSVVKNEGGECISCISKFRPDGVQLFDTLFEKGLLVCEPLTETLFDDRRDGMQADGLLAAGRKFSRFCMNLSLQKQAVKEEVPFTLEIGRSEITAENGALTVTCPDGMPEAVSVKYQEHASQDCASQIEENQDNDTLKLEIHAGSDSLRVFINGSHLPAVTVETKHASGAIRMDRGVWEIQTMKIVSETASFAGVLPLGEESDDPVWDIACWHSRWNWIKNGKADPVVRKPDGSLVISNPGRSFTLSPDRSRVILEALGSMEYPNTRRSDEGWSHLLLEVLWDKPEGSRIMVEDLKTLWLTMDVRMLQCENRTVSYNSDIHAAQFVTYFNIRGKRNEAMWLGLCNMDSRFLADENRQETICQMDPGTNTFIIAPPQKQFVAGHLADGQWHSMSLDLKPVIQSAWQQGRKIGAFSTSSLQDLWLNSMNLGYEIPGTFDMKFELSQLQLAADYAIK